MLLAEHNLVSFDHVPQLRNFRVLVPTKCCCCCAQVDNAAFNLLGVQYDETTVKVHLSLFRIFKVLINVYLVADLSLFIF